MSEQDNTAPHTAGERNITHAFTDPNPFLSEDRTLHVAGRATPMQRAVNAPERREA
ncbi:hypothetical protein [Cellulomonas fimi]|uniref:Uncharacterized protein n=1 Tax=Cellulomonas fimi (strain ATCC 484 / DSM 20113 / JCM 1341 / CCUG 24087 / LMG 16345 / NBRC 15513 / NCIMB 8980 / NCTC 7547 / NRS-133) TaxID=590998 RepID=F4H5D5_CELFA|nr:hypothetical protein [Cellulomonas fimi]AEE47858.1 hypothetical protein Celf_3752 [Cellulomonas fimi ATCC 484]NNH06004.1 hypothetical protein [Cellulomonas fimi]